MLHVEPTVSYLTEINICTVLFFERKFVLRTLLKIDMVYPLLFNVLLSLLDKHSDMSLEKFHNLTKIYKRIINVVKLCLKDSFHCHIVAFYHYFSSINSTMMSIISHYSNKSFISSILFIYWSFCVFHSI